MGVLGHASRGPERLTMQKIWHVSELETPGSRKFWMHSADLRESLVDLCAVWRQCGQVSQDIANAWAELFRNYFGTISEPFFQLLRAQKVPK